jgi:site-specific recombinase XerC
VSTAGVRRSLWTRAKVSANPSSLSQCANSTLAPSTIYEEERANGVSAVGCLWLPSFAGHAAGLPLGSSPMNKGLRYPADPPSVEEIVAVMRGAGDRTDGVRLRALIVVLWRGGLRISEGLRLTESDLDPMRGAILVRRGKGGKRREVGMDQWGWDQLRPWLEIRAALPVGALFCVIHGPTCGRRWSAAAVRAQLSRVAARSGVRRRFAPHQLRHAHAVEMAREGVPLVVIQPQLGHANLGITSVYLQGIDNAEIIDTVHARPAPVIPAIMGLRTTR